ncbi:MAG: threonine ammonia-lyase [Alphaproteobacteria bacterium]
MVNIEKIKEAANTIAPHIRRTPTFKLDHGNPSFPGLYVKLEQLQVSGSFKYRGVCNKLAQHSKEDLKKGIVAASGGNHGRAVAYAGWKNGIKTTIFLPTTTPEEKVEAIRRLGAEIIIEGTNLNEASNAARDFTKESNGIYLHPYDDKSVINGQGTIALEVLEDLPGLEEIIIPIGGGGMMGGMATAIRAIKPDVKIIGVEPEGCPTLYNSCKAGKIVSIESITTRVGTLAIKETSQMNFDLIQKVVDDIVLVSDQDMLDASRWLWKEFGIAAELSGSAAISAILSGNIKLQGATSCAIVCGLGQEGLKPF